MRRTQAHLATVSLAALGVYLLAGCAVGPDYTPPAPPAATGYTKEPLARTSGDASVLGGAAQSYDMGRDIPAQWWSLFHSPALDGLVKQALANNPDIADRRTRR